MKAQTETQTKAEQEQEDSSILNRRFQYYDAEPNVSNSNDNDTLASLVFDGSLVGGPSMAYCGKQHLRIYYIRTRHEITRLF